jgi:hypothetical protein
MESYSLKGGAINGVWKSNNPSEIPEQNGNKKAILRKSNGGGNPLNS